MKKSTSLLLDLLLCGFLGGVILVFLRLIAPEGDQVARSFAVLAFVLASYTNYRLVRSLSDRG